MEAMVKAMMDMMMMQETQRLAAEKRGLTALRYQTWEDGVGGVQVRFGFSGSGFLG